MSPDPDPSPSTADGTSSRTDGSRVTPRFDAIDAPSAVRWRELDDLMAERQARVRELFGNLTAAVRSSPRATAAVLRVRLESLSADPRTLTGFGRPPPAPPGEGEGDDEDTDGGGGRPLWWGWAYVVVLLLVVIWLQTVLLAVQFVWGCEGLVRGK